MSTPRLVSREGVWEGRWRHGVAVFRGIRYAAAPVGDLRWSPPAPAPAFEDVRPAVEPGPACPQPPGWDEPYRHAARLAAVSTDVVEMECGATGEDCLRLDVFTPDPTPGSALPVMTWLHGGASVWGSGSAAMFDGARLASEHGVVVVTVNYRLGALGFLAHPEMARESRLGTAGNYGFLDQVAALEWIREHATAFGGDADNLTVFGESAGGRAVFELLAHPAAKGLFRRAIAQSPWEERHHRRRLETSHDGLESGFELGERFARELGLSGSRMLDGLRQTPTHRVLAAADRIGFPGSLWGPLVDGVVFPDHPLALVARGETPAVPLLVGSNADEGTIFFLGDLPFPTAEAYRGWVESIHPRAAADLLDLYPPSDEPAGLHRSFSALYGDRTFAVPGLVAARALAERTAVHVYRFTHVHPPFSDDALASTGRRVGCFHASEIPLVFGTVAGPPLDDRDESLGRAMRRYWASFARDGEPGGGALPVWPRYRRDEERYLELGDKPQVRERPLAERFEVLMRDLGPALGIGGI